MNLSVSIVIPSYNACERLYLNLMALNCQSWPMRNFEVIVVDNGSNDNTRHMVEGFKAKFRLSLIRLEKNMGIAYARNRGIEKARGDLLIFHDSDMIANADFVKMHVEAHKDRNTVVCGVCWKRIYTFFYPRFTDYILENYREMKEKFKLNKYYQTICGRKTLIDVSKITDGSFADYSFDLNINIIPSMKKALKQYGENLEGYIFPWRFFITNNCSVYRQHVLEVGLLDEKIVLYGFDDYDLGYRLYKKGCRFNIRTDILSVHQEHPKNFTANDVLTNCFYISDKYNNINDADMLVYCSIMYTNTPESMLEGIVSDIWLLRDMPEYRGLVELYMALLEISRELTKGYIFKVKADEKIWELYQKLPPIDKARIKSLCDDIYANTGSRCFVNALYQTLKNVLTIDIEGAAT